MIKRSWAHLAGGAGGVALLGMLAATADAATVGGIAKELAGPAPAVERVADRPNALKGRAATKRPRGYGYVSSTNPAQKASENQPEKLEPFTYGMKQPDEYPFGSGGWWRSMQSTGHIR